MVIVDVPVYTGQDTIGRRLDVVTLPGTCGETIGILEIAGETVEFLDQRTAVGVRVRKRSVTSTGNRSGNDVVLVFTIQEEEQLVLDNRATECCAVSVGVTIIDIEHGVSYTVTFQRGTCKIGIEATFELIGTTLRNGIDATTGESTLTNVIRRDGDGHLIQRVERDRCTATRQRAGTQTEGIVE